MVCFEDLRTVDGYLVLVVDTLAIDALSRRGAEQTAFHCWMNLISSPQLDWLGILALGDLLARSR